MADTSGGDTGLIAAIAVIAGGLGSAIMEAFKKLIAFFSKRAEEDKKERQEERQWEAIKRVELAGQDRETADAERFAKLETKVDVLLEHSRETKQDIKDLAKKITNRL